MMLGGVAELVQRRVIVR